MPDTERYREWAAMVAASDNVLVQLVLIAAAAVFAWERLRSLPAPWRDGLRLIYMAAALGFLLVQVVTTRGLALALLALVGLSAVGRAVWDYRTKHLDAKGQTQ